MSKPKKQRIARPDPVYRAHVPGLPTAVIFDMDGTMALLGGRNPYDASTCDRDPINPPVVEMARILCREHTLLALSGREDKFRPQTEAWLKERERKSGVMVAEIHMRKTGDKRNDAIVKAEIFRDVIAPRFNVVCAFDDRDRVVEMWRWLGIPCFQVQPGDF